MLAFTDNDHWRPGIGDPTIAGWMTVAAYFVGAWLCWRAGFFATGPTPEEKRSRWFWSVFALGLVALGVNKQLDLQTWFTLFAKHLALEEGWYRQRRALQAVFIGAVAVGGAASLAGMRLLAGRATAARRLALAGGIFLGCFVLIRASSFHHVDRMLGMNLGGLKVNWMLELGSIGVIASGAAMEARSRKKSADGPNFIWLTAGDRERPIRPPN